MAAAPPPMELVDDIHFLRQDNANLLKEVMSLRQQSTLLRDRSDELERKLRGCVDSGAQQVCQCVPLLLFHVIKHSKMQRHPRVRRGTRETSVSPLTDSIAGPETHRDSDAAAQD